MIKNILLISLVFCACNSSSQTEEKKAEALKYTKEDLKKISWIEGKWKGMYNGEPFYEIYHFINDTTIETTHYKWDGKDSSGTSKSYTYFKDGAYYHGEKQNWKVDAITDTEIKMLPNVQANNDILWRFKDKQNWDAILTSKNGSVTYNMQYFDPFTK